MNDNQTDFEELSRRLEERMVAVDPADYVLAVHRFDWPAVRAWHERAGWPQPRLVHDSGKRLVGA